MNRACRICGCTESMACDLGDRGCEWVDDPQGQGALCSACLPYVRRVIATSRRIPRRGRPGEIVLKRGME